MAECFFYFHICIVEVSAMTTSNAMFFSAIKIMQLALVVTGEHVFTGLVSALVETIVILWYDCSLS